MSVVGMADDPPQGWFDRALQWIPRVLSSKPHVVFLSLLGVYLVLLPLFGVVVSAHAELIGGNYTNVTSDIGACIAAGGTLHLIRQGRRRMKAEEERTRLLRDIHGLLHDLRPHLPGAAEAGRLLPPPPEGPATPPHPGPT